MAGEFGICRSAEKYPCGYAVITLVPGQKALCGKLLGMSWCPPGSKCSRLDSFLSSWRPGWAGLSASWSWLTLGDLVVCRSSHSASVWTQRCGVGTDPSFSPGAGGWSPEPSLLNHREQSQGDPGVGGQGGCPQQRGADIF